VCECGKEQTDRHTHTQTAVTTIHFASAMPHAKCNEPQSHGPMSNSHCECVDLMHMQSEWISQRGNSALQFPLTNSDCWWHLTTSTSGNVAKIQKTFCGLESSRMARYRKVKPHPNKDDNDDNNDTWELIFTSHRINHASSITNQNNMIIRTTWLTTKPQACWKSPATQ